MAKNTHNLLFNFFQTRNWAQLVLWLSDNYPTDIPMPCHKGTKAPISSHTQQQWTWHDFDKFGRLNAKRLACYDIGILLNKICVIDIDSLEMIEYFENKFPILTTVACERTTKGKHYFFERSQLADERGYFDGHAQVYPTVDFKSICSNGTAGYLVVSPSTGKNWIRSPFETPSNPNGKLLPIPDYLLAEVAVPTLKLLSSSYIFKFLDGTTFTSMDPMLRHFQFIEAMIRFQQNGGGLSLTTTTDPGIIIPFGSAADFEALIHICRNKNINGINMKNNININNIRQIADYTLLSEKMMKLINPDSPVNVFKKWEFLSQIDPEWRDAIFYPQVLELTPELLTYVIIFFTFDISLYLFLKRYITYTSFKNRNELSKHHFLLPYIPMTKHQEGLQTCRIDFLDNIYRELPVLVKRILKLDPRIYLAGGAALRLLSDIVQYDENIYRMDYDLFFTNMTEMEADEAVQKIINLYKKRDVINIVSISKTAVTFSCRVDDGEEYDDDSVNDGTTTIQIIVRIFSSVEVLLNGFDIAPCEIALNYDAELERFRAYATTSWLHSMKRMTFIPKLDNWNNASIYRLFKYYIRGFEVLHQFDNTSANYLNKKFTGFGIVFNIQNDIAKEYKLPNTWFNSRILFSSLLHKHLTKTLQKYIPAGIFFSGYAEQVGIPTLVQRLRRRWDKTWKVLHGFGFLTMYMKKTTQDSELVRFSDDLCDFLNIKRNAVGTTDIASYPIMAYIDAHQLRKSNSPYAEITPNETLNNLLAHHSSEEQEHPRKRRFLGFEVLTMKREEVNCKKLSSMNIMSALRHHFLPDINVKEDIKNVSYLFLKWEICDKPMCMYPSNPRLDEL